MEIDAKEEFDKLKRAYAEELESFLSGLSSSLDLTFDQQVMERLMDLAPPGLDEVMALNMAMEYMAGGRYDMLILDSAPTGHLIRLLETPEVMDRWLKVVFDLLLKYKTLFRLPELSRRLVRMSKDLKILRGVLSNPDKSALYAVSILTRMAFEETRDLVDACRSMGIPVPVLFLNMATRNGPCPLCASVHRRETLTREKFDESFPELHRSVIYRQPGLRGMKKLGELASCMYEEAKIRRTKP
jgi:arsenite-transporting ATPase